MWVIHSKLICRVTIISFVCREMFFLLLEHSELTGNMLSLSVSGACRQGSNAGELVCGHGVPYCVLDCGIIVRHK